MSKCNDTVRLERMATNAMARSARSHCRSRRKNGWVAASSSAFFLVVATVFFVRVTGSDGLLVHWFYVVSASAASIGFLVATFTEVSSYRVWKLAELEAESKMVVLLDGEVVISEV